jgi:hypothetical protein
MPLFQVFQGKLMLYTEETQLLISHTTMEVSGMPELLCHYILAERYADRVNRIAKLKKLPSTAISISTYKTASFDRYIP